jgi:hypothetical protein
MQTFKVKLKNVPTNASLVCSSTNLQLNKDQSLSVVDGLKNNKLALNNLEVNRAQQTERSLKSKVFVLSKGGVPLMPCSFSKSKRMVKKGVARVIKRFPFTIQLNFECEDNVQSISLGIDTGYGNIGFSCTSENEELISGTLVLDPKTKSRLDDKKMYRKGRRNKLRYREPKFNNRRRGEDWLPPSIQRRYDTHLNLIERLKKLLPISQVIVEIAKFDIQKIENPDIEGKEYQQGNLYEYQNVVSYLKCVQNNKCSYCEQEFKSGDQKAVHHIYLRGDRRRTDRVEGLVLLHKDCHSGKDGIHAKHEEYKLQGKVIKNYKHSTFMSIINKRFYKDISNLKITFGNITFVNRNQLNLEKSHINDAFVISGGSTQTRCRPMLIKQKHRNNRKLQIQRKGFIPSIRKQRYKIQPLDLVWVGNKMHESGGCHNKGQRILINKKSININKVTKYFNFGGYNISYC